MKRLAALISVAAALVVIEARGDEVRFGVNGIPGDVEIADAGLFVVTAGDAGFELWVDPIAPSPSAQQLAAVVSPALVNAYLGIGGCLFGIDFAGVAHGCSEPSVGFPTFRVRHYTSGGGYAWNQNVSSQQAEYQTATGASWAPLWPTSAPPFLSPAVVAIGVLRWAGHDYASLSYSNGSYQTIDNGTPTRFSLNGSAQSIDVFVLPDAGVAELYGSATGLQWFQFDGGGRFVALDAGNVTGVAFNGLTGAHGEGFGMAISLDAGDSDVFSAIPDPSMPGQQWLRNDRLSTLVGLAGPLVDVRCWAGDFCVLWTHADAGVNAIAYRNVSAPGLWDTVVLNEGQGVTRAIDAGDNDGDAIFITWDADGGAGIVSIQPASADHRTVTVIADGGLKALCNQVSATIPVYATLTDGLASHERTQPMGVQIIHTYGPGPISLSAAGNLSAGGFTVSISAIPDSTRCAPQTWIWSLDGGALLDGGFAATGSTLTFKTPDQLCQVLPVFVSVTGQESNLSSTDAGVFVIQPYGRPNTPNVSCTPTFTTGGRVTCLSSDGGACVGVSGYPGTQTIWTLDAGSTANVRLSLGGVTVTGPVTSPTIDVVAGQCQPAGQIEVIAQDQTLDANRLTGGTNVHRIDLIASYPSLSDAGLFLDGGLQGNQVTVVADATAACASLRGLRADLTLEQGGVPLQQLGSIDLSSLTGTLTFTAPAVCVAQPYSVVGTLKDNDGGIGPSGTFNFATALQPPGLSGVTPSQLTVRCGSGASGLLAPVIDAGFCPFESFGWSQLAGPPVGLSSDGGAVFVSTSASDLDSLLGNTVRLGAAINAGPGNTGFGAVSVVLVPAGDEVTVTHSANPPLAHEGELVQVAIELKGTTTCPMSNVTYVENTGGLSYVPGSARLDGTPFDPADGGNGLLTFAGIRVAFDAGTRVTYSARTPLFTSARPSGQAFVQGYPVSPATGLSTPALGCSCQGGVGPLGGLGLLAWILRRRGRSKVRARS